MAARAHRDICFVVADLKRGIPLASASVHVLLNVFAPRNSAEFGRVVAPGGMLLVVLPAAHHLASLRSRLNLLGIEEDKERRVADALSDWFELATSHNLEFEIQLEDDDVNDLLQMSPNYWHRERQARGTDAVLWGGQTTAAFTLLTFIRRQVEL